MTIKYPGRAEYIEALGSGRNCPAQGDSVVFHYGPSHLPIDAIPSYREAEIESRRHTFHVDTPARRRERRGIWISNILFAILIAALIAVWYIETLSSPSVPGAATTQGVAPGAPLLDVLKLEQAIARIESGNRNLAPYWDVNGIAWGLYGMHMARWCEIGGTRENFGKANADLQRRLFRTALGRKSFKTFEAVARWHNGTGKAHFAYAIKLEREYKIPSPVCVAPATNKARRGASQPASGNVLKRKVKP